MENTSTKKDGFVFYKSFYESINALDESMQLEVYQALAEYGLTGEIRDNLSPITKALLTAMIPTIDNANKRYVASVENGKKGGRPKKNKENPATKNENLEKPNDNLDKPRINLTKPNDNLEKPSNNPRLRSGKPNHNPYVSESVYDSDTMIKDKKRKIKDKTVVQAQQMNYITEILLKKKLLHEDEVEFIDDLIVSSLQSFDAIDIKCKCEYILSQMQKKQIKDRMKYFKTSFENGVYKDFQKKNIQEQNITKPPDTQSGLDLLAKFD